MSLGTVRAYDLDYYDCSNPQTVTKIDVKEACLPHEIQEQEKAEYKILQRSREEKVGGFRCQIEKSDFLVYCGSFSHQKLMKTPEIDVNQAIPSQQCWSMVTTQSYRAPGSTQVVDLELGAENVFAMNAHGVLHDDHNVWCEGEQLRVGETVVEQVLELVQLKITITPEDFIVRGQEVEVVGPHIRLSKQNCGVNQRGCQTSRGTYVWDPPLLSCSLKMVRKVTLETEGEYLVDHEKKLFFQSVEAVTPPLGCPTEKIYKTLYPDLYLAQDGDYSAMNPADIDVTLYTDTRLNYLEYNLEKEAARLSDVVESKACSDRYDQRVGRITKVGDGKFGVRTGDAFMVFACPQKTGIIKQSSECWDKVPLVTEDDKPLYVDLVTRVATRHAAPAPCLAHFPLYVQTKTKGWIQLRDTIVPVDPPEKRHLLESHLEHQSFSGKGLYTEDEIRAWEVMSSYGTFQDSVVSRISTGVCQSEKGPCASTGGMGSPSYSLSNLVSKVKTYSPLHSFNEWIIDNAAYISISVLIFWAIQLKIVLVFCFYTLFKDGPLSAMATLYVVLCSGPHLMSKARNRRERNRKGGRGTSYSSTPTVEEKIGLQPV